MDQLPIFRPGALPLYAGSFRPFLEFALGRGAADHGAVVGLSRWFSARGCGAGASLQQLAGLVDKSLVSLMAGRRYYLRYILPKAFITSPTLQKVQNILSGQTWWQGPV